MPRRALQVAFRSIPASRERGRGRWNLKGMHSFGVVRQSSRKDHYPTSAHGRRRGAPRGPARRGAGAAGRPAPRRSQTGESYVATNSIRHVDELYLSSFVTGTLPNFGRSILLCIEADFCDQVPVGKR